LSKVDDYMRPLVQCRLAAENKTVREVFVERSPSGRRTGAIMLTGEAGKLVGIFTDSDLARLFESRRDAALDGPIRDVMTAAPRTVPRGSMMVDAVAIMAERKISELPVIDAAGRPAGLIDITDVVSLFPEPRTGPVASGAVPSGPVPSGIVESKLPAAASRSGGPPKPKHPSFTNPANPAPRRESA